MTTDEKLASVLRTLEATTARLREASAALNTACVDLAQAVMELDKAAEVGAALDEARKAGAENG